MNLLIECSTGSQCGGERSNPQAEACNGEPASRNVCELDSASLHYVRVTKLPKLLKSDTSGEETFVSSCWTLRGDWRWRVGKDKSRNLRDPARDHACRESDGLIVAGKDLTRLERRGLAVNAQLWRCYVSA